MVGLPRAFTVILTGLTVSKLGDALYTFALPWIAFELTHSAVIMGTLYATEILPILLFGALAGVYVDRWDRRKLMLVSDIIRAAVVALIPLLHLAGLLAVWHLYLVAFVLALVSLMFDVSTTAVIPEMAGGDLTRANAAHQMAMQVASMAGPALAGLVIAAMGGFNSLWLDALSFGGTFAALTGLPAFRQLPAGATAAGVLRGMVDGLKWLWQNRVIRVLSLQAMTGNFGFGMVSAVLMYYLRQTLGLSAQLSGLDYAMLGVGGLVGSILVVPLVRRYRRGVIYPAILLFGMAGLLIMAAVRVWWAPGLGVLSTAAMPVGATLGGLMTKSFDPGVVFLVAAAAKGIEVLIARFSAMYEL
jgi:MFS family permease